MPETPFVLETGRTQRAPRIETASERYLRQIRNVAFAAVALIIVINVIAAAIVIH